MIYTVYKKFIGSGTDLWKDPKTYEDLVNYLKNWINEPVERKGSSLKGENASLEVNVSFRPTLISRILGEGNVIMKVKIIPHKSDFFGQENACQLLNHLGRFSPKCLRDGNKREEEKYDFRPLDSLRHIA